MAFNNAGIEQSHKPAAEVTEQEWNQLIGVNLSGVFRCLKHVRPANRQIPRAADGSLPEAWMLAEWPPHEPEPTDYWLSKLSAETPLRELVGFAKQRWRVEHDYRELKTGLGLDHFEGRYLTKPY